MISHDLIFKASSITSFHWAYTLPKPYTYVCFRHLILILTLIPMGDICKKWRWLVWFWYLSDLALKPPLWVLSCARETSFWAETWIILYQLYICLFVPFCSMLCIFRELMSSFASFVYSYISFGSVNIYDHWCSFLYIYTCRELFVVILVSDWQIFVIVDVFFNIFILVGNRLRWMGQLKASHLAWARVDAWYVSIYLSDISKNPECI